MSFFAGIFAAITAAFSGLFGMHADVRGDAMMQTAPQGEERRADQGQPAQAMTDTQISAKASTDADLDADLKSVDVQIGASAKDSASIDASLNDKPVSQTE